MSLIRARYRAVNTIMNLPRGGYVGLLDLFPNAAAAYSLRKLRAAYSGAAVRVRRSSDNTEQDIAFDANGDLDTASLLSFVNEDVDVYTSDFSSTENLSEFNGTGAAAQSVGGVDDAYKFTLSGGGGSHFAFRNIHEVGKSYEISFDVYVPSGNSAVDGVLFSLFGAQDIIGTNTTDEWVTLTATYSANYTNGNFYAMDGGSKTVNADGDVFYLKNIVVTQTTADGFVTVWYDQSLSNDATQTTAADQPKIVNSGSLVTENGKAAIEFDGADDYLAKIATLTINGDHMISAVHTPQVAGGYIFSIGYNDPESIVLWGNNVNYSRYWINAAVDQLNSGENVAGQRLTTGEMSSGAQTLYINGSQNSTKSTTYSGGSVPDITIGYAVQRAQGSNYLSGKAQEFVFFNSGQSANRTGIEGNINDFYSIY